MLGQGKHIFIFFYFAIAAIVPQLHTAAAIDIIKQIIIIALGIVSLLLSLLAVWNNSRWNFLLAFLASLFLSLSLLGQGAYLLLIVFFPLHFALGWILTLPNQNNDDAKK